jgi:hypothetical protein
MKIAIEFEEIKRHRHQFIIDYGDEKDLDLICNVEGDSFDDVMNKILSITRYKDSTSSVLSVTENYEGSEENMIQDKIEYFDSYWTKDEELLYGPKE